MLVLSMLKLAAVTFNTVVVSPVVVAVASIDERASYLLCRAWARANLLACGVRVSTRRLAPLDPDAPFVFMSNHRSQMDILAVVDALPEFQLRWVAKKELADVPIFGWAMQNSGHIVIDRSNTEQAVASLRAARAKMAEGISVVIFPEGTRSVPGQQLLPFKKGGFMLALETGFPIVPVIVRGSGEILPRGSWQAASGEIEVIVGAPIPVVGVERDELMRRVEAVMREHLAQADPGAAEAKAAKAV